jgi:hypothetical protein
MKKIVIVGVGVALLAVATAAGGYYFSGEKEKELNAEIRTFLYRQGLTNVVRYRDVSVSLLNQTASVNDITVDLSSGDPIKIGSAVIGDYEKDDSLGIVTRASLELDGLEIPWISVARAIEGADLPLRMGYARSQGRAHMTFEYDEEVEVLLLGADVRLEDLGAIHAELSLEGLPLAVIALPSGLDMGAPLASIEPAQVALRGFRELRLRNLAATLTDEGGRTALLNLAAEEDRVYEEPEMFGRLAAADAVKDLDQLRTLGAVRMAADAEMAVKEFVENGGSLSLEVRPAQPVAILRASRNPDRFSLLSLVGLESEDPGLILTQLDARGEIEVRHD